MPPKRAILLVRISDDREGEALGVGRQEEDGRSLADRIGWKIAEVIVENDVSAFKRRRVTLPDGTAALRVDRPGLRKSLALLTSGERDGLIAYDLDRYTRDPRDLEDLIDLVEQQRVPVTSYTGSLRLDTDADITMARVMVAVANKSSRDTSRRVKRKHEQLAEQGKPSGGGRRAFGYDADGMTVRPDEAAAIREMARIVVDGGSTYDVVNWLEGEGIQPPYAASWSTRSVVSVLSGPRIVGQRVFRGEVVGAAAWPAILEQDTWDAVQAGLAERRASSGGSSNSLKWWLNGVLYCALCQQRLWGWSGPMYWCASPRGGCGSIRIDAPQAQAEVARQVVAFLKRPEVHERLAGTHSAGAVRTARTELAADERQLKELAAAWARNEITFAEYGEARRIIAERVASNKALVSAVVPPAVRTVLQSKDPSAAWEELTPKGKRAVVLAIVRGYWVVPAGGGFRSFEADRLRPIGPHEPAPTPGRGGGPSSARAGG